MNIQSSASARCLDEIALFPFDDHAIPLQRGVQLYLKSHRASCGTTRIVLAPGPAGAPDCEHVAYYGAVIRLGDELWMWYLAQGDDEVWFQRVHLATSRDGYTRRRLWNRGNLIIGFYGMWNGHPSNDRRMTTMDLSLAVSNDGLHYREPIPNFPIVSAADDGWLKPPHGDQLLNFSALIQGQGFENIGAETLFWYGPWPEQKSDGLRIASWERDRLGYFQAYLGGPLTSESEREPHIISAPIDLEAKPARLSLNIDRVSEYSGLSVEIFDERLNPHPGYSRENCDLLRENGYN